MSHPRLSGEEIERRGQELYAQRIREQVETEKNKEKILSVDVETGDYEIADTMLAASRRLLAKHPDAAIWALRIGYDVVYSFDGPGTDKAMITGTVINHRPTIPVILHNVQGRSLQIEAVIDTGFNGFLTLPVSAVSALTLTFLNYFHAGLADGSRVRLRVYAATLLWDGEERDVEVLATGIEPLLGTALLDGYRLEIDFREGGLVVLKLL